MRRWPTATSSSQPSRRATHRQAEDLEPGHVLGARGGGLRSDSAAAKRLPPGALRPLAAEFA
eukprot:11187826-Lingulodinium_polyedra.AAC.1